MYFEKGNVYHVYNQGNNRQLIFFKRGNYIFFLKKVRKELFAYLEFLAYCLMPNHFHFMVYVKNNELSQEENNNRIINHFATLLRSYTRAINIQQKRTGSLFRQKTKSKNLYEYGKRKIIIGAPPSRNNYAYNCLNYIHMNPVKAGLVKRLEDWEFSSFRELAGLSNNYFCNKELAFDITGLTSDNFYDDSYGWVDGNDYDIW